MGSSFGSVLMFGSVALASGAAALLGFSVYRQYFEKLVDEAQEHAKEGAQGVFDFLVRRLGQSVKALVGQRYSERITKQLIRAGNPYQFKPQDILALQIISAALGLLLGLMLLNSLKKFSLYWAIPAGAVGIFYPLIWLNDRVTRRHMAIGRAMPFVLDLLTLSVEAGLDFPGALAKVVERLRPGPLLEELQLVMKQLKMGKTREEGLKSMAARCDYAPLSQFVASIIQADKMGTSLGKILRIQAQQLRNDRTNRAEKLANEAPVKMLFPLIACIFPTVFMILFGPIIFAFVTGRVGG